MTMESAAAAAATAPVADAVDENLSLDPGLAAPLPAQPVAPAEPTRTKRAAWSYASNMLFAVVTMGVGLVTTPLLIRFLGTDRFGAVRAATDLVGYTGLLEIGLSGAVLAMLAQAIGGGDAVKIRAVFRAAMRSYQGMTVLMILVGAVLSLFVTRFVPVPPAMRAELRFAFYLLVASLVLTPFTVYRYFAEAGQRGYIVITLLTIQSLATTLLCVAAAWVGLGIPGQVAAATLAMLPTWYVLRRDGRARMRAGSAAESQEITDLTPIRRQMRQLSLPTFGLGICYRLGLLTDNLLVAWFWGSAAVVPFFVTQRLASIAQSQLSGFTNATWAGFSHLDARGEGHRIEQVLCELTRIVMVLGVAGVFPIVIYNSQFVSLWVGHTLFGGKLLTAVAGAVAVTLPITTLWSWVLGGSGRLGPLLPQSLVSTAVNVTISILATWRIGLAGPLIGTLSATVLVNMWWLPLLLRRHFDVSPFALLSAIVAPVLLGVPFVAGWAYVARHVWPHGWLTLAAFMAAAALSYLLAAWFIVFRQGDRDQLKSRLRLVR